MAAPEARIRVGECDVLILGTISGFVPDAGRVQAAFLAHRPTQLALGIPPDDLAPLDVLADEPDAYKEMVPPDDLTGRRLELLKTFGEVRIPSPDLEAAHKAAKDAGVPIDAIDLDDRTYADEYTKRMKLWHVMRNNSRLKKLLVRPYAELDAYTLEVAWDNAVNELRPLTAIEKLRERHMANRLRDLATAGGRLLALVPVARFSGIVALVQGDSRKAISPTAE